ncbi:putative bifunctional diguanylate cyclase/phosphodiesterase [Thermomonas alba]|uniref:putative bifunctional diguanylate cyclase/phosphodiesterase n=1 Tax=Thermomonas alba TaxID=2888525 RepID=UPI001F037FF5|nr:EAL domain-containing protein [Thermomonas alba]
MSPAAPADPSPVDSALAPERLQSAGGLDDVLALARALLDMPMAAVIAFSGDRYLLVAQQGLEEDPLPLPREHLFVRCWEQHAPLLVLPELPESPRSAIRAHVGIALEDGRGRRIGLLAVCDRRPRTRPGPAQLEALGHLARLAANLLLQEDISRDAAIVVQAGQHAREAVLVADRHGGIRWSNPAAQRLFGHHLRGQRLHQLFPLRLQPDTQAFRDWLAGSGEERLSLRIVAPDGSLRQLEATRSTWRHGHAHGTTLILHDVTEAAHQRAQLDRLAHFDPLTGLPNRNALLAALEANPEWGLALIGIDRFKWINDGLGHALGDRVLQAFAERLQAYAHGAMGLARVEGDVFAITGVDAQLCDASAADDECPASPLLREMLSFLQQPLRIRGHEIHIELSVGLALREDVRSGGGDLLACADLALQRAKAAGGRQLYRYRPQMRAEALARRDLDLELRRAFAQGEFELHYQPQIDLASGRICGAEALLRWRHPTRGLVPAGEFIELLSRSPLGAEVGAWVLQRACTDAAAWPAPGLSVSVNLFPAQLRSALVPQVLKALADSGLPAQRLELEITETIALAHDSEAAAALAALREHGVNLAFDDFGTGYASLAVLHRFRIDRVKIDRSFVSGMLDNGEDAAIVRWTVMLARALGLKVVAEGVEQLEQAEFLQLLGCDEAQGYLYAPALPDAELLARLRRQDSSPGTPANARPQAAGGAHG